MSKRKVLISELVEELKGLYEGLSSVTSRGFWVFDMQDMATISSIAGPSPIVGIIYNGGARGGNKSLGNGVSQIDSVFLADMSFVAAIGIPYRVGTDMDAASIVQITDVLDEAREKVLGYRSVNKRGWSYAGESPVDLDVEGMIFYGQVWVTSVVNKSQIEG